MENRLRLSGSGRSMELCRIRDFGGWEGGRGVVGGVGWGGESEKYWCRKQIGTETDRVGNHHSLVSISLMWG